MNLIQRISGWFAPRSPAPRRIWKVGDLARAENDRGYFWNVKIALTPLNTDVCYVVDDPPLYRPIESSRLGPRLAESKSTIASVAPSSPETPEKLLPGTIVRRTDGWGDVVVSRVLADAGDRKRWLHDLTKTSADYQYWTYKDLEVMQVPHPLAANRSYGWHRSTRPSPHPRYEIPEAHRNAANLPLSVDLSPECPAVYDQGQLGSCTANALAGLFQFLQMKLGLASWVPSRLMIYYNERASEGTIPQDAGANGDDGVTSLQAKGVCPESLWAYDINQFAVKPPSAAYGVAYHNKLADPVTIADGDLQGIKSRLASGFPVAFGFTCYPELESQQVATTGILPLPQPGEQSIGGHEVLIVGYNESTQYFKVRNSWGPGWGQSGYFLMPYAYVGDTQLAGDFRSASSVN